MNRKINLQTENVPDQWWSRPVEQVLQTIGVDPKKGLSPDQVIQNREKYGSNQMQDSGPTSLWTLLWESVKSPMMVLLLVIAGISLALGQLREAFVMVFVVAMYVGVHLLNKARSDRTMARLREVQAPKTIVLRAGERTEVALEEVVVGDIVPLQSGSRVPADARLMSSAGLVADEASLTGEAAPVQKRPDADIAPDAPLAERKTAVFAGTTILDGQGQAVVVAVGMHSELGRVAELSTRRDTEPTPLQREMSDMARALAAVAIGVSLLIPLVGLLRGFDLHQMLLTWLSLTFLMVPGQPPIIIALVLALASLELAHKQVIVRRLQGAETLGSVNVVLSDKTGTMTESRMELVAILLSDGSLLKLADQPKQADQRLKEFFLAAVLAIPENSRDATDLAVVHAAERLEYSSSSQPGQLLNQAGFSRTGTYRSLEYGQHGQPLSGHHWLYLAGRPEYIIDRSIRSTTHGGGSAREEEWTTPEREQLKNKVAELASQGKRLIAYAYREGGTAEAEPQELTFAGVAVISDPIRPEVKDAIRLLEEAGVRTVMVTGDIKETAVFVAQEVGITGTTALTGHDLEGKSEQEMQEAARQVDIYARTTPEQKLKLVQAFQRLGQTVAVTGDGINDAPALNTAHIGIAMGQKGTDVAKEAADLILTDDNFAHLPDGVAIGRKAYDNFRKGITYYLSAKAILLSIFVVPLLAGFPFPLAPIQIIFTELLMDLASATIFVTEAAEPNIMQHPPRKQSRFLDSLVALRILRNMAGPTIAILVVYFGSLALHHGVESARTAAFSTWLLGHILLALNLKQDKTPLFRQGLFSNRFAIGWLIGMIFLVLAMTLVPFVQSVLQTTRLSGIQWKMIIAGALLGSLWLEIGKWQRLRHASNPT